MPLPKISTPTYELILPSTSKKIKYRPYLVREEKVLLIALESKDQSQITNEISNILQNCILTSGVDVEKLPLFDIEYLFLHIRARSAGEVIELEITCPDDEITRVPLKINIDDIPTPVKSKAHNNKIQINKDLTIEFKYPSLRQFIESNFQFDNEVAESNLNNNFEMVASCVDRIYNSEEVWQCEDLTKDEIIEFFDDMSTSQFKKIESFFETMPKLKYEIEIENPKTKVKSKITLEGLADFFG